MWCSWFPRSGISKIPRWESRQNYYVKMTILVFKQTCELSDFWKPKRNITDFRNPKLQTVNIINPFEHEYPKLKFDKKGTFPFAIAIKKDRLKNKLKFIPKFNKSKQKRFINKIYH